MKNMFLAVSAILAMSSAQAFASSVYCIDTQNSDYVIKLEVEQGKVVKALFTNQDHGDFDNRYLAPSEYSLQGNNLIFGNDTFVCR